MRTRLIALGALAAVLAVGAVAVAYATARLQFAGQQIGLSANGLSSDAATQQRLLFYSSVALNSVITPLAIASVWAVAAILAVLARRTQLRRQALAR